MKRSDFDTVEAYKIYANYIEQVNELISTLPKDDILDIMNEIDSHIYESFICNKAIIPDKERIKTVISNLGEPQSYLKSVIVEKQFGQAVRKYNIEGIFKDIKTIILTSGQYMTVFIMYLFLLTGSFLVIAKILYPHKTGLFMDDENIIGFGYIFQINAESVELLGYWFIPIMIISCIIFYFLMTFILKKIVQIKAGLNLKK
jgi:hypothetical protein